MLVLGAAAFVLVLAGWVIYDVRRSSGWTLYPVDFNVYRDGGLIIRHIRPPYNPKLADPLYTWSRTALLSFTYTPFAAVSFAVVSFVPPFLDSRLEEAVNVVALVAAAWCTMRALGWTNRRVLFGGALLGAAAGLLTEPVFRTIYLGQINIVLMLMVIWDLTQPDTGRSRWWKGFLTGVAGGIKLVPLIFIPYLLITRRFRQAFMAIGGFAFTVLVGFALAPHDSADFWFNGLFIQDGRTGFPGWSGNQSLRGLITRLAGGIAAGTVPWLVLAVVVAVAGLVAAALLYRAWHEMLGLLMTALVGLLCSPISWDHHWVWVVPGMMAAGHYATVGWRSRRRVAGDGPGAFRHGRALALSCGALAVAGLLVFFPWPGRLWGVPVLSPGYFTWGLVWAAPNSRVAYFMQYGDQPWYQEYHWHHDLQMLAGNAYVLAGLGAFIVLCAAALTAARRSRATATTDLSPPLALAQRDRMHVEPLQRRIGHAFPRDHARDGAVAAARSCM
jgi:alpha-1,2-mannosyltransferase